MSGYENIGIVQIYIFLEHVHSFKTPFVNNAKTYLLITKFVFIFRQNIGG